MKIAVILPTAFQWLEEQNDYHMALAHLIGDEGYDSFFQIQSDRGNHVIMDNGVVETGEPMPVDLLIERATRIHAKEVILPDHLHRSLRTYLDSWRAIQPLQEAGFDVMAVPQGGSPSEWRDCVLEMIDWPVDCIGISRFVLKNFLSRNEALECVPELLESRMPIHILGCPEPPNQVHHWDRLYADRIRGIDSGAVTFFSQAGVIMTGHNISVRPQGELQLIEKPQYAETGVWERNYVYWRGQCLGRT